MPSKMNYETDGYSFDIMAWRKKKLKPIADAHYNGNFTYMINSLLDKVIAKNEEINFE